MNKKEKYHDFCKKTYVPIYSKPWWMDIVCGSENWDVWLYEKGSEILAAMPYYMVNREEYKYITKAPLTQNNGIIFEENKNRKLCSQAEFEEKVIISACEFIKELKIDVYEQQYMYTFKNWLPFFWNGYKEITRYTYVIENTANMNVVWNNISSNYRNKIRKGEKHCHIEIGMDDEEFYIEHEKVFTKQNLRCPFSKELWLKLSQKCRLHGSGITMCARNEEGKVQSLLFLVWDERSMYQILGGNIPEYQKFDTYAYLIWKGIEFAADKNLVYDFEGSVISKISKSFREFGGEPKPYFRIRKVFNSELIQAEALVAIQDCINK